MRGYIEASGVPKKGSCHVFRHTMARLMLEGGADIRYIQAMLGHVSLETTKIYTQVSIRALVNVHATTHPAAGLSRAGKVEEEPEVETHRRRPPRGPGGRGTGRPGRSS